MLAGTLISVEKLIFPSLKGRGSRYFGSFCPHSIVGRQIRIERINLLMRILCLCLSLLLCKDKHKKRRSSMCASPFLYSMNDFMLLYRHFFDTCLMASAFKFSRKEFIQNLVSHVSIDETAWQYQDVGIVVLAGKMCNFRNPT